MFAHARIATTVFLLAALAAVSYRHAAADGTPVVFSNADEVELGRAERATILEQFGGEIPAAELRRYVESLGQLIARGVERKDVTFSFTVLDTPIVNAFATVGGYVYVTRGLVTLADSEAELAAMLAHALAHQARRDGVNAVAEVRLAGLRAATAQGPAEIGHVLAAGALVSFSREQEVDVDERAVRYLARSGHDTDGLARILTKLRRDVELEAVLRDGRPEKTDPFHFAAQHPLSNDRIERAARLAVNLASRDPLLARDAFLDKIDGLVYGDAPGRGFVRGRVFADPIRRIQFEAPPGFRLFITADGITAFGPLGARMVFNSAREATGLAMPRYIAEEWARGARIAARSSRSHQWPCGGDRHRARTNRRGRGRRAPRRHPRGAGPDLPLRLRDAADVDRILIRRAAPHRLQLPPADRDGCACVQAAAPARPHGRAGRYRGQARGAPALRRLPP